MKKIKSLLIIIGVISLCILLVYFYISSSSYKSLYLDNRLKTLVNEHKVEKYKKKFRQQLFTENKMIEDVILRSIENKSVSLRSLINETKLIYRYSSKSCGTCVEQDIEDLKQLGNIIGNHRIIIISSYDYDEIRLLRVFKSKMNIKFPCYNYPDNFNLPIESDTIRLSPSFFLIDSEQIIHFTYKSDDDQFFNQVYLERIKDYFINGN